MKISYHGFKVGDLVECKSVPTNFAGDPQPLVGGVYEILAIPAKVRAAKGEGERFFHCCSVYCPYEKKLAFNFFNIKKFKGSLT